MNICHFEPGEDMVLAKKIRRCVGSISTVAYKGVTSCVGAESVRLSTLFRTLGCLNDLIYLWLETHCWSNVPHKA